MSRHPHHGAHAADAHGSPIERSPEIMDLLERELKRATDALLEATRAAPGTALLDLACGLGHTTDAARRRGADALGVDLAPAAIEAARRRFPETRFAVGDMLQPPPGPWDAITCRFGAHHADAGWIPRSFDALAPGGRLAIAEFDRHDARARENGMRPAAHWMRLFDQAGFRDIAVTTGELRLGALLADDPRLAGMLHERNATHFEDGLFYVVFGVKP